MYSDPGSAHSALMDHLHGLMGHPHIPAAHKADYAKVQGLMAALQAKMHAEPLPTSASPGQVQPHGLPTSASPGPMGGVQNPEETGYPVGQMQAMPDLTSLLGGHTFQAPTNPLLQAL